MFIKNMKIAPNNWLVIVILSLIFATPNTTYAGMSPEEVKTFEKDKAKANLGDADGQFGVGLWYAKGVGVPENMNQAVYWWKLAAMQGHPLAQLNMGYSHTMGVGGTTKDFSQAVIWFKKAADHEVTDAFEALGMCYKTGQGVPKDEIEAYAYFNLAGASKESARRKASEMEVKMPPEARLRGQKRAKEIMLEIGEKIRNGRPVPSSK